VLGSDPDDGNNVRIERGCVMSLDPLRRIQSG